MVSASASKIILCVQYLRKQTSNSITILCFFFCVDRFMLIIVVNIFVPTGSSLFATASEFIFRFVLIYIFVEYNYLSGYLAIQRKHIPEPDTI